MSDQTFRFVYKGAVGEIEEKKSRFIAAVEPVSSEEEALSFLTARKKEFWDARHNCHAFVVGEHHELQRCSDDGEPAGTAGRPMLEILIKEGIHDTAVVVTRYFGGTLLGTGGLVRAYQGAVREALSKCLVAEKRLGRELSVETDYPDFGKLQYLLGEKKLPILGTEYTTRVETRVMVPETLTEALQKEITDATGGRAVLLLSDPEYYAEVGKEILRFS